MKWIWPQHAAQRLCPPATGRAAAEAERRQQQVQRLLAKLAEERRGGGTLGHVWRQPNDFGHSAKMPLGNPLPIFDRPFQRVLRGRAAQGFARHAALADGVGEELAERLAGVARRFDKALVIGGPAQALTAKLTAGGIAEVVVTDLADMGMATRIVDDEALPFPPACFDLVIGNLNLHRVNDVVGVLTQMVAVLQPGGLFLAAFIGGYSLHELRGCLLSAELAVTGGASPRLHPTISLSDASTLLQRTGLQLPVTDQETYTLTYSDALNLMRDLRGMGEGNSLIQRQRNFTRRAIFTETARLYAERHEQDGRIPASFDIVFLHGWKA